MKSFVLVMAWMMSTACVAQSPVTLSAAPVDVGLGITTLTLWEGGVRGAQGDGPDDQPALTVLDVPRTPQPGSTPASSLRGGGGYLRLAMN